MARNLIVAVAVDLTQYVRGMGQAAKVTEVLDRQVKELDVNVTQLAQAQVAASVKSTERLRSQAAAYRQLAASAERGSHEQIAAARLAADTERRLASSLGATARETNALRSSTRGFERDLSHATRGALSGSGALRGFGRSLAFASGGFIAFQGVSKFLTDSINAAREAGVAQRSLTAQMKASGESFAANRDEIERAALSYGKFGFQNDEVIASLTVLERGTGKISQALKLQGLAADIARARTIGLSAAANVVAKVFGGQETALRRAVPGLAKNAHGWDLIRLAQAKMAGQAAANTTTSEAFAATLHNTEEIIGTGLLPTLNKYLTSLGKWLQRMNESGKLQKDVADATDFLASAIAAARAILAPFIRGFQLLAQVTGSTTNAIKTLGTAFLAWKITGLVSELGLLSTGIKGVGTSAVVAEGEVAGLRGGLAKLGAIGPITIGVTVAFSILNTPEYKEAQKKAQSHAGPFARILDNLKQVPRDLNDVVSKQEKMWNDLAAKIGLPNRRLDQLFGSRRRPATPIVTDVTSGGGYGAAIPAGPSPADVQKVKRTAEQLNQWFDAMIGRRLGRIQYEPLRQQLAALGNIAALITQRIAKTKDITRRLNLETQLLQVLAQRKDVRAQLAQQATDALALNIQRAGLTATMSDDIAALNAVIANLDQRIALEKDIGKRLDLESQLIGYQQQRIQARQQAAEQAKAAREAAQAALEAAQFRGLGLGPGGEDLPPSIAALKKQLAKVRDAVKGTILDTRANRGMFANITSELAGHFGKLTDAVKQKVKEMLDSIDQQLGDHASRDRTAFRHINAANFVASLGLSLTPEQARRLQVRISQVGAGGTVPGGRTPAFAGVTVNGDVHVHGVQDTKGIERELHRRAKARANTRRGAQ